MSQFGEELAFLKTQAAFLQNIPVTLDNSYQPALEDVPKRVHPFQVRTCRLTVGLQFQLGVDDTR